MALNRSDAQPDSQAGQLGGVAQFEFVHHVGAVIIDCFGAAIQTRGDFIDRQPLCECRENFMLTGREGGVGAPRLLGNLAAQFVPVVNQHIRTPDQSLGCLSPDFRPAGRIQQFICNASEFF